MLSHDRQYYYVVLLKGIAQNIRISIISFIVI